MTKGHQPSAGARRRGAWHPKLQFNQPGAQRALIWWLKTTSPLQELEGGVCRGHT